MTIAAVATENYLDVQKLLYRIVHDFLHKVVSRNQHNYSRNRQWYFDEALSEAHLRYVEAERTYDPSKAAFTTWIHWKVVYGLKDWWENFVKHNERWPDNNGTGDTDTDDPLQNYPVPEPLFSVGDFLDGLSDDARTLATLVLNDDLSQEWDWYWRRSEWRESVGLPERISSARKCIKQRLLDMGWAIDRIRGAWSEIQEVLT